MSNSISRNLLAYVRERFPPWLALLLPLVLTLAALRQKATSAFDFTIGFAMAMLLVFELRMLDDLADLKLDREIHPERVLCRSVSLKPFVGLLLLLTILNFSVVAWLRPWWGSALLLFSHLFLLSWYGGRGQNANPVANYHVVLLKYPLIVLVLGATTLDDFASASLLFSTTLVYLGLCVYEVVHDGRVRALRGARFCLAVECLLLAVIGCLALNSTVSHWRS